MKTLYLFIGTMGSGKTFLGQRFAKKIGAYFYDGDESLPPELKAKVARCAPLTREEVALFVRHHLWWDCLKYANQHGKAVVSQALYSDEDRIWLAKRLRAWGLDVIFVYVKAPMWRNLKQLWGRKNGLRWCLLHLLSFRFFQQPSHFCLQTEDLVQLEA